MQFKVTTVTSWSWRKKGDFLYRLFCPKKVFLAFAFISIHSLLNTLSEYTYFYISKNITSYTFLLVFKIVESLQCILKIFSLLKSPSSAHLGNISTFWNKVHLIHQKTLTPFPDIKPICLVSSNWSNTSQFSFTKSELELDYYHQKVNFKAT